MKKPTRTMIKDNKNNDKTTRTMIRTTRTKSMITILIAIKQYQNAMEENNRKNY